MPDKIYKIRNWLFSEYGRAVDHCIKHDLPLANIKMEMRKTVAEVEKETGVNYGCQPCIEWHEGRCQGAKPGAFYYPTECPSFSDGHEEEYEDQLKQDYHYRKFEAKLVR